MTDLKQIKSSRPMPGNAQQQSKTVYGTFQGNSVDIRGLGTIQSGDQTGESCDGQVNQAGLDFPGRAQQSTKVCRDRIKLPGQPRIGNFMPLTPNANATTLVSQRAPQTAQKKMYEGGALLSTSPTRRGKHKTRHGRPDALSHSKDASTYNNNSLMSPKSLFSPSKNAPSLAERTR